MSLSILWIIHKLFIGIIIAVEYQFLKPPRKQKGKENWFDNSGSSRNWNGGKISVLDYPRETSNLVRVNKRLEK